MHPRGGTKERAMTTGQSAIEVQELGDEIIEVFLNRGTVPATTTNQILYLADRDMYLNQGWFRGGTTQSDGATYTIYMVEDGVAIGDSSKVALTDSVEVHSSGGWAVNTKSDFTPSTTNYVPAGALVYLNSSENMQTTTPVIFGLRFTTRAH